MKNGLNSSKNEVYTIRRKLFEMFLEIIDGQFKSSLV